MNGSGLLPSIEDGGISGLSPTLRPQLPVLPPNGDATLVYTLEDVNVELFIGGLGLTEEWFAWADISSACEGGDGCCILNPPLCVKFVCKVCLEPKTLLGLGMVSKCGGTIGRQVVVSDTWCCFC